jgi:hypothetical protein
MGNYHDESIMSGDDYKEIVRGVAVFFWSAIAAILVSHGLYLYLMK